MLVRTPACLVAPLPDAAPRRLRVCHLAYTFYERDNRVRRYAESLVQRGHDVEVMALRRDGQDRTAEFNGVRVSRLQRRRVNEGAAPAYLAKILMFFARSAAVLSARHLRRRYDVVHVHNVPDFLVFAGVLPKLSGARLILDIHDILPELYSDKFRAGRDSWIYRRLCAIERHSARFADHVIVAGDLWRGKLIERAGVDPQHCSTMLNHPDRNLFKVAPAGERRNDGKFVILYPGTLNYHQGVDVAVRGFALARERMPKAEFHIYGEGPSRDAIATLIQQLGVSESVKLFAPLPIEQIAGVMSKADLGVIPKRAEGFGNEAFSTKSLEFMACGVPIIMSRTQVDGAYFDDSTVRFFTSADPEALAGALVGDYQDPQQRLARASRASSFVAQQDWASKLPSYLQIVEQQPSSNGRGARAGL